MVSDQAYKERKEKTMLHWAIFEKGNFLSTECHYSALAQTYIHVALWPEFPNFVKQL